MSNCHDDLPGAAGTVHRALTVARDALVKARTLCDARGAREVGDAICRAGDALSEAHTVLIDRTNTFTRLPEAVDPDALLKGLRT